jgi:hypothetical protein
MKIYKKIRNRILNQKILFLFYPNKKNTHWNIINSLFHLNHNNVSHLIQLSKYSQLKKRKINQVQLRLIIINPISHNLFKIIKINLMIFYFWNNLFSMSFREVYKFTRSLKQIYIKKSIKIKTKNRLKSP